MPRPSAAEAPGRPCPPRWLPAALGVVLLRAGPDGERPQRRTDLPQRELREGGDSGNDLVSLGGFPPCLPCRHTEETFECSLVCSAGLLILFLLFICRGCWRLQKDQSFSDCRLKEVAALASSTNFPWTQLSILMTGKGKGTFWWSDVSVLGKNGRRGMCEILVSCIEGKRPVR